MDQTICLDDKYSTTQLVTEEKPIFTQKQESKVDTFLFLPKNEERNGEGGLRTEGYFKKSYEGKPLISIITVVFNDEDHLKETIKSVIKLTHDNVEYIIVDGGSTDRTLEIIREYEDKTDYWISEPDKGIYNAMNKGIDVASGEWVIFMNSGDQFVEQLDLKNLLDNKYDIIYGDCIVDKGKKKNKTGSDPENLRKGMCFCHQAMFFKANILKKNKFNENLKISGDYDQIFRLFDQGYKFKRVDNRIAHISSGGISDVNRIQSLKESYMVCKGYKNCNKIYFVFRIIVESMKIIIKKFLKK